MSDSRCGSNPYVVPTGEGYVTSRSVYQRRGGGLKANLSAGVLRRLGAEQGDIVGVHPRDGGAVLASPPLAAPESTRLKASVDGIQIGDAVLRSALGIESDDERVRVYDHPDGLLIVSDADDPRVGGEEL